MNSKNKNIIYMHCGINEFKRSYKPYNNFVKDQNGNPFAGSHNILNRQNYYFSQLLDFYFSDVKQIEIHIAESSIPGPCCTDVEVEIVIAKLKKNK
jgi:hypothetical protein